MILNYNLITIFYKYINKSLDYAINHVKYSFENISFYQQNLNLSYLNIENHENNYFLIERCKIKNHNDLNFEIEA